MTATFNPRTTAASMPYKVFVHETFQQYGETWAIVNKGTHKTSFTFKVLAKLLT